jgi:subtilisin family serine protease
MRSIIATMLAALVISACSKQDTSAPDIQNDPCTITRSVHDGDIIPGQYIISYNTSSETAATTSGRIARASRDILMEHNIPATALRESFSGIISGFVAQLTENEAAALRRDASVQAVEHDRIVALGTCFTIVAPSLITWNINMTGYGNGIGKTAWVIDTGIDFNHPDLTVDRTRSHSFLGGTITAEDENGHGTHVAGIIGAKNNDFGVLGVASGATLVSLRVLDKDGTGTLSSIIQALSYVNTYGHAGDVVNLSLGEEEPSEVLDQAVQATAARGIYVTIAAGNDARAADLYSPGRANAQNIYTVSAVDSLGHFASFSNYGNDAVDFAAPGVRILSTYKNGQYARMSGTSMAAPHLAGLLLVNGGVVHSSGTAIGDPDGTPDRIAHK